jgi:hypothetical protein
MRRTSLWVRTCVLCAVTTLMLAASAARAAAQQTPTTYNITLAIASQFQDDQGRYVVTMQAAGDLPGVLTLALATAPDGTVTSGEWAFNASYTAAVNPNALPDYSLPDPDEPIGEKLIQLGVLNGSVSGGFATLAGSQVQALTSVQLAVEAGTVDYAATTTGSGSADGTAVNDPLNSTGSMTLTF